MKLALDADDGPLSIGVLARETGCKVPTIRYYEQMGLIEEPGRTEGNQRRYGQAELDRLVAQRQSLISG